MADTIMNNDNELSVSPSNWRGIYRIGAIAALAILPFGIMDILITFLPGGATPDPGEGSVKDWIGLFQRDSLLALRGLGLLNIFTLVLGIPVFYALYAAHRRLSKPIALFALMLFLTGAAIYIARNPAFPMQTLATKYTLATTDYQRSLLTAAGEAILAGSEDFTSGSFMGFFFINIAGILMSSVIMMNRRFSAITGWAGFVGFICMLIYSAWASFIPWFYSGALVLGILGGLLTLSWYVLVAQKLLKLG